jgi:exopolysaccharide production protein ExoQ
MTLIRPLDALHTSARAPRLTLKESGKIPALLGFAIFVSSVGFAIPLPQSFYLQAVLCPMIVAATFLFTLRDQQLGAITIEPMLALVCTWSVMSIGWTIAGTRNGVTTSLLLVSVVMTSFFGSSIVSPRGLLRWLTYAMSAMLGLTLLYAVVSPGAAFSAAVGEVDGKGLRGLFAAKNTLGQTLIYAVVLRVVVKPGRWRIVANVSLMALLVLCNNSGAIIAATCVAGAQIAASWAGKERARGSRGGLFVLGGLVTFAVVAVVAGRNIIFGLVGRGSDLTGRDVIWKYTFFQAKKQLWTGYGVAGFWKYGGGPAEFVRRSSKWAVTSAHQGWLDTLVEYGVVGVVLVFLVVVTTIARVVQRLNRGDTGLVTIVGVGMIVGLIMGTLSESTLVFPGMAMMALTNGLMYNDRLSAKD